MAGGANARFVYAGVDRATIEMAGLLSTWRSEGWLHLPAFFGDADVAAVNEEIDLLWVEKPARVTVDDVDQGRRCRMSDLADADRSNRVKISDLFLTSAQARELLLNPFVREIVAALLGEEPVLCNSLNLERSSGQDYHADSLFMTPRTPGRLAACWIALEDVLPGSGPLRLYPSSHRIPRFVFSDGSLHADDSELPRWAGHMQSELDARRLQPVAIYAQRGDLVIWHGDLLHGAEPIADRGLTRRSLVAHYFGLEDCFRRGYSIAGTPGARWLHRRPQPADFLSRVLSAVERRVQRIRSVVRDLSAPS